MSEYIKMIKSYMLRMKLQLMVGGGAYRCPNCVAYDGDRIANCANCIECFVTFYSRHFCCCCCLGSTCCAYARAVGFFSFLCVACTDLSTSLGLSLASELYLK